MQSKGLTSFPMEICNFHELKLIENFWEAYDLTKVDLSNNEIESIPEEIVNQEVGVIFSLTRIDILTPRVLIMSFLRFFADNRQLQLQYKQAGSGA